MTLSQLGIYTLKKFSFRHHAKVLSVSSALSKASLFELKRYCEENLKLAL